MYVSLLPFTCISKDIFSCIFFGYPQLNDDFQKQQMEKEASEKHIEELDEKIQQADVENEKVGEQHKKSAGFYIFTKFEPPLCNYYFVYNLHVFWHNPAMG